MKNKVKIRGNDNSVIQDVRKTNINANPQKNQQSKSKIAITGLILTVIGLIVAIIVGWDNILKFFKK